MVFLLWLALIGCGDDDGGGGERDAGRPDAGVEDAGRERDGGVRDSGPPDAGPFDAGPPDAGPSDAGPVDAGPPPPPERDEACSDSLACAAGLDCLAAFPAPFEEVCRAGCASTAKGTPGTCASGELCLADGTTFIVAYQMDGDGNPVPCTTVDPTCDGASGFRCMVTPIGIRCARPQTACAEAVPWVRDFSSRASIEASPRCNIRSDHRFCEPATGGTGATSIAECVPVDGHEGVCIARCDVLETGEVLDCGAGWVCGRPPEGLLYEPQLTDGIFVPCTGDGDCNTAESHRCTMLEGAPGTFCGRPIRVCIPE